jgi:5S rRNA maturation endonuclease (ribonuclease M5)/KaiC/GvpD/RAD55 family RecA-like ATPase
MSWIEEVVDSLPVKQAAQSVGMTLARGNSARPCLLCKAENRGTDDSRGPVGFRNDSRGWTCHACKESGDTVELLAIGRFGGRIRELSNEDRKRLRSECLDQGWCKGEYKSMTVRTDSKKKKKWALRQFAKQPYKPPEPPAEGGSGPFAWAKDLPARCVDNLWSDDGAQVLAYLQGRGFSIETLEFWNIGAHLVRDESGVVVEQYVAIPVPRSDGVVVNMRFRSVPGQCLRCGGSGCRRSTSCKDGQIKKVYLRCPGAPSTLFGTHLLEPDHNTSVVIVEGELDVMAMWQYGVRSNIVSGTAGAGTWADEWLDQIEPYQHFQIAYDNDKQGEEGAQKVSNALGQNRCSRVKLPADDAAECLKSCISQAAVYEALDQAAPMMDVKLVKVDSYADQIEQMIANPDELRGLTTGSAKLDEGIGGWRPGLVLVTGDTAAGKTSFTTWCKREQALRGVACLGTSFEQRPIGTVQKLLRQELGTDFTLKTEQERRAAMARLGKLPLYMLDHYGELDADACLEAIDYAVRRRGVRFAVVDHLGFLVRGAEDERKAIENAVRTYALAAVNWGITIVLICHPNNLSVVQQRRVQLSDLKGASAIRQDAHVGLVIERLKPGKSVQHPASAVHVDKCRSEFGMQGSRLVMYYDPEATVYADSWEATPMGRSNTIPQLPSNTKRKSRVSD